KLDFSFGWFCSSLRSYRLRCLRKHRLAILVQRLPTRLALLLVQHRQHLPGGPNLKSVRMEVMSGPEEIMELARCKTIKYLACEVGGMSLMPSRLVETGPGTITSKPRGTILTRLLPEHWDSLRRPSVRIYGKSNSHTTSEGAACSVPLLSGHI